MAPLPATTEPAVGPGPDAAADPLAVASLFGAFDDWVDARLEPWRGRPLPDAVAATASFLGDHGLIWFLVGLSLARRPGRSRRRAVRAVAFSGIVVPAVNGALKRLVDRTRPPIGDPVAPAWVRTPTTASFPSGHALAAGCAATLLAEDAGLPAAAALYGLAGTVAVSRVQLRHHHASDVVAGAVLGVVLGRAGRRLLPLR
ncbi:MAG: phosphatase PAP2 family protein [Acidimicrobiales bacterium]